MCITSKIVGWLATRRECELHLHLPVHTNIPSRKRKIEHTNTLFALFFLAFRCVLIRICLPLYNTALKSMLLHNSRRALTKSVVATRARYFISHLSPPRANREPQSTSPRSLSLEASPSPHRTPLSTSNPSPPCSRFAPPPCARTAPPAPPCTPRSPPSPPPPQRATAPFSLRFTAHRARAVVSHRDAFPPSSVAPSFRSPSRSHLRAPRSRSPAPLSPRA